MKEKRAGAIIMRAAAALFLLTLVSSYLLSGMLARYATNAEGGDNARTARWDVGASMQSTDVKFTADEKYGAESGTYYAFTVTPGDTEVASKYGVTVTLTDQGGRSDWPDGLTVKLTDAAGGELGADGAALTSDSGVFENVGTFAPGDTGPVGYRLYFSAGFDTDCGSYAMDVAVQFEQVD